MVKGALLRQQLHGTVQVGARDRASEDDKESSTNKMATKRRHHLPHRYQYNLNPFPFLFIRIVLWSNVMWSSVYDLGVHSCSLGIQDGKPGCRAPDAAASDDGYSECIAVHPCVSIVAQEILSQLLLLYFITDWFKEEGVGGAERETNGLCNKLNIRTPVHVPFF